MFSIMEQVYHLMEDEESKAIFKNRVLYNITEEKRYIDNIVSFYARRIQKRLKSAGCKMEAKTLRSRIGGRKLVVYGIGHCGFVLMHFIHTLMEDVEIVAFCDCKAASVTEFFGHKVISVSELLRDYNDTYVIVTPMAQKVKKEILSSLVEGGFSRGQIMENIPFDLWALRGQYFDEEVISLWGGETFIDAGCLDCVTTFDFIKNCPDYKEIIAFEPDSVSYNDCLRIREAQKIRDFKIYNMGLWNEKAELSFLATESRASSRVTDNGRDKICGDSLDNILRGKDVSFIKMDIEGAELKALHGCKEILVKHRPKLAICVYHKKEDIVEIPLYLHDVVPEYKFYMRHYSVRAYETVLYAVADSRMS